MKQARSPKKKRKAKPVIEDSGSFAAVDYEIALKPFATGLVIVLVLAFAAHTISLWSGFAYLDVSNIDPINNLRDHKQLWSDLLLQCLTSPLSQPLVQASYLIDVQTGALKSAAVYHAVNLGAHVMNALLLYYLILRLGKYQEADGRLKLNPYVLAAAGAGIFACHPLACEAVSYISARSALLVTMFYLGSLHLFMTGFTTKDIKLAVIAYLFCYLSLVLAVWSGDQAITAPLAFILLAVILKPSRESYKAWIMDRPFEFFAQLLVALLIPCVLLLRYIAPIGNGFGLESLDKLAYIATQFKLLVAYYLRCFLVPLGLSLDPPVAPASGFADPLALLGIACALGIAYLAYRLRNSIILSFACILFVLSVLPFIFIVQPELVSDRRIYLSLCALSIFPGYFLASLSMTRTIPAILIAVLLLCGLTGISNWRNWQWRDGVSIWKEALDLNPQSPRSRAMYAWALAFGGRFPEGAKLAEKEYAGNPYKAVLSVILGTHYGELDAKKEKEYCEKGLALAQKQHLSPELVWRMQAGLADASYKTGDYKTAVRMARKALEVQPNNTLILITLGKAYLGLNNPNAAFVELQKAYVISRQRSLQLPDVIVPMTRAALGCGAEKYQDLAYGMANQARRVFGTVPEIILLQAYAALETGRVHESMGHLSLFLSSEKPTAECYYLLWGAQKKLGNEKDAATFLRWAKVVDPDIQKKMVLTLKRDIKDKPLYMSDDEKKNLDLKGPDVDSKVEKKKMKESESKN